MLFYGNQNAALTQSDIAKILKVDKGNISRNVKKLVHKTYLVKTDEHKNRLELIEIAKSLKEEMILTSQEINTLLIKDMSVSLLEETSESMKKMITNLEG